MKIPAAYEREIEELASTTYGGQKEAARLARFHHAILQIIPYEDFKSSDDIQEAAYADHADGGIDLLYIDAEAGGIETFVCVQVKDSRSMKPEKQREAILKMANEIRTLRALGGKADGLSSARHANLGLLNTHKNRKLPVRYLLVLTGEAHGATGDNLISSANLDKGDTFAVLDRRELIRRWEEVKHPKPTDLSIRWRQELLLQTPPVANPRVIMGWVSAADFVTATKPHGKRLFQLNPRLHLGKARPNQAMHATLKKPGPEGRGWFHLLNNGITAVCSSMKIDDAIEGYIQISMHGFQVVNGCQTTETLWSHAEIDPELLKEVWISLRVIVDRDQLGRRVSESTNRQSAITPADLRANDDCQRRIKKALESAKSKPIFYEARRGEWDACRATERAKFRRSILCDTKAVDARISMKEMAQALQSVKGNPAKAKESIVALFSGTDKQYEEVFESSWQDPDQLLLVADLFRILAMPSAWLSADDDDTQHAGSLGRYVLLHILYERLREKPAEDLFNGDYPLLDQKRSHALRLQLAESNWPCLEILNDAAVELEAFIKDEGGDIRRILRDKDCIERFQAVYRKECKKRSIRGKKPKK